MFPFLFMTSTFLHVRNETARCWILQAGLVLCVKHFRESVPPASTAIMRQKKKIKRRDGGVLRRGRGNAVKNSDYGGREPTASSAKKQKNLRLLLTRRKRSWTNFRSTLCPLASEVFLTFSLSLHPLLLICPSLPRSVFWCRHSCPCIYPSFINACRVLHLLWSLCLSRTIGRPTHQHRDLPNIREHSSCFKSGNRLNEPIGVRNTSSSSHATGHSPRDNNLANIVVITDPTFCGLLFLETFLSVVRIATSIGTIRRGCKWLNRLARGMCLF